MTQLNGPARRAVLGGALGTAGLMIAADAGSASQQGPIVELLDGKLRGRRNGDILVFKGVPYGDTTGGENRFGSPRPVKPWAGVRDATQYGPASPQPSVPMIAQSAAPGVPPLQTLMGYGDDSRQGEDCLVLNIWTPALADQRKRPVMFRIHGGGYNIGSGSWPQSDGTALAKAGDVVVVTVNHRLGALGFLYLAEIGGDRYADSGNAGMLDLIAALRWVQTNISAFGGDSGNVTIFGESGGGSKVSTLLAMPAAKGLFQRAIVESGPSLKARTASEATAAARSVLDQLKIGPSELHRLHTLPADRLLVQGFSGSGPLVDGRGLPAHPAEAFTAGAAADVPLLIGYNQTEGTLLVHLTELPALAKLDEAGLRARLAPMVKGNLEKVIDGYRRNYPDAAPGDLLLYIETAHIYGIESIRMADLKSRGSASPVYMYLFNWRGRALNGQLKAAHGLEVPFTMRNPQVATALSETPGSQALVDKMSAAWIAFARSGDPNVPSRPNGTVTRLSGGRR